MALDASFMHPTLEDLAFTDVELSEIYDWMDDNKYDHEDLPGICTPHLIGPTWMTEKDAFGRPMGWHLPERSLGWHIAEWCSDYILADDGTPWNFTLEQLRFILWWYAINEDGEFIYRTGVLQRLKGWGKDPLLGVICLVEFVGPSRFSHWGEDGQPRGQQAIRPWVLMAAVNQEQTRNTMDLIPGMMSDRLKREYNVRPGIELIRAMNGKAKIQAIGTTSYRSIEGKRTTFTLLNETQHWVQGNRGHEMFETLYGNASKMSSRFLAITNAFLPGEDSVAERMRASYDEISEGKVAKDDYLYDSVEADDRVPLYGPILPRVLERIRGDAYWLKIKSILSQINDPLISPARSRRMWLNQVTAAEDSLHSPTVWGALYNKDKPPRPLREGDAIVMGFDGGKSGDSTALVCIRLEDHAIFVLGLWEAPEHVVSKADEEWQVDRLEVDFRVRECFRLYKVRAFYADVSLWESYIDNWGKDFGADLETNALKGHPIAWDMRTSLAGATYAHERLLSSIWDKNLCHNGDRRLTRHVLAAKRDDNQFGVYFRKEMRGSSRKIDAYAALMLAHEAMMNIHQKVRPEPKKGGSRVWFY